MISAQTLEFLKGLRENNNKPWFEANKKQYQQGQKELIAIVEEWKEGVVGFDPYIIPVEPQKVVFRIYRDIRFSKDKTPYKTNLGAYMSGGGKNISRAGYYLHVEPGQSMFGGGLYLPEGPLLEKVRQEIDYNLTEFEGILNDKDFKKAFPKGLETEHILKNPPKGYDKTHPAIELLRLKSFFVVTSLSDKQMMAKDLDKKLTELSKTVYPLIAFLNRAID